MCPLRFSSSISHFYLLPLASTSYAAYSARLTSIAKQHRATLFIPVSGAGSSVEDARAADAMYEATAGVCRTFIQDPETMLDLHDKDRFQQLVGRLGMTVPRGKRVESVQEAIDFIKEDEMGAGGEGAGKREPKYVFKCMGLDENRGDMTLFPLKGDDAELSTTRRRLEGLRLRIGKECPYVFQEYIPGQGASFCLLHCIPAALRPRDGTVRRHAGKGGGGGCSSKWSDCVSVRCVLGDCNGTDAPGTLDWHGTPWRTSTSRVRTTQC